MLRWLREPQPAGSTGILMSFCSGFESLSFYAGFESLSQLVVQESLSQRSGTAWVGVNQ